MEVAVRALGIDPGKPGDRLGRGRERGPRAARTSRSGTIVLGATDDARRRGSRACTPSAARCSTTWAPAVVVLERAFVARNVQSAFRLGEARGAVLAAVAAAGVAARTSTRPRR